jgi:hypothetical protein
MYHSIRRNKILQGDLQEVEEADEMEEISKMMH